jgi:hypothetical protein
MTTLTMNIDALSRPDSKSHGSRSQNLSSVIDSLLILSLLILRPSQWSENPRMIVTPSFADEGAWVLESMWHAQTASAWQGQGTHLQHWPSGPQRLYRAHLPHLPPSLGLNSLCSYPFLVLSHLPGQMTSWTWSWPFVSLVQGTYLPCPFTPTITETQRSDFPTLLHTARNSTWQSDLQLKKTSLVVTICLPPWGA